MQKLTPRQREIFNMLLKEIPPKEIAYNLHITYNTLLTHQRKLYRNLGVKSVQELIAKYPPGTILIQKDCQKIHLQANRWSFPAEHFNGENWSVMLTMPVEDLPPHLSSFSRESHRYAVTISGTADHDIDYGLIKFHGNAYGTYLGNSADSGYITIKANVPFAETVYMNFNGQNLSSWRNDYSVIYMDVSNELYVFHDEHPEWNVNNGSLPADIPDGQIMATISNFAITLKDTKITRKSQDFVSF